MTAFLDKYKQRKCNEMSYFLFGTFSALQDEKIIQNIKEYAKEKDIYIWFNEEITFCNDIQRMIIEQKSKGNMQFAITSTNQPWNSSDVLFPFDKTNSEVLFSDETGEFYKRICRSNINILFACLNKMKSLFDMNDWEIFVVEGYDNVFHKKKGNLDGIKNDLLLQIVDKKTIDSCIYYVN